MTLERSSADAESATFTSFYFFDQIPFLLLSLLRRKFGERCKVIYGTELGMQQGRVRQWPFLCGPRIKDASFPAWDEKRDHDLLPLGYRSPASPGALVVDPWRMAQPPHCNVTVDEIVTSEVTVSMMYHWMFFLYNVLLCHSQQQEYISIFLYRIIMAKMRFRL